jgi:hypothetical protein
MDRRTASEWSAMSIKEGWLVRKQFKRMRHRARVTLRTPPGSNAVRRWTPDGAMLARLSVGWRHRVRVALLALASLTLTGCYEDTLSPWSATAGMAEGKAGGSVPIEWEVFPAGGTTTEAIGLVNAAVGRTLLVVGPSPRITFTPMSHMTDPRTGQPTIGGSVAAPSTVTGSYESCAIFYDPDPAAGFSWPVALHEIMHCLGFNDITNFENGPFQRCDDDPDMNGDGRGDFHYMPEPSIMSYCNNPWVLTGADVRGLRNAGYTEASPDDEVLDHGGGD